MKLLAILSSRISCSWGNRQEGSLR